MFSATIDKAVRELRGELCYVLEQGPEPKTVIACNFSFSRRMTEMAPLKKAVVGYLALARAGEKLRAQGRYACALQVFLQTGQFNQSFVNSGPIIHAA